ncbi:acetyltransferase [Listeria booriae]|uniref:acetyltransferase n=1 Tax=Listeria booriae TaxID=1552123 RepID=UPI0016274EAC|nr:acetyltransferase [Listeria booriae]MBC1358378.1 acetyltransferase [Listeria booriae]
MMHKQKLILIGDGSVAKMAKEIVALMGIHEIIAVLDDKYTTSYQDEAGVHIGPFTNSAKLSDADAYFIAIGNNEKRQEIFDALNVPMTNYVNLIHPHAIISPNAKIGYGNFIMAGAIVNVDATIENQCIVNSGCIVGHDAIFADFSQASPGTVITGYVNVQTGVNMGANVTVLPSVSLGEWSVVGAGSTVTRDVEEHTVVVGTPAKLLKRREVKEIIHA